MAPFRCRLPPACMPPAPACMPDHCARRQVAGDVGEARTKGFGGLCRFPAAQVCGLHGGWYPQAACAGCLSACSATRVCASTMHALPTACHVPSAHFSPVCPPLFPMLLTLLAADLQRVSMGDLPAACAAQRYDRCIEPISRSHAACMHLTTKW